MPAAALRPTSSRKAAKSKPVRPRNAELTAPSFSTSSAPPISGSIASISPVPSRAWSRSVAAVGPPRITAPASATESERIVSVTIGAARRAPS